MEKEKQEKEKQEREKLEKERQEKEKLEKIAKQKQEADQAKSNALVASTRDIGYHRDFDDYGFDSNCQRQKPYNQ